MTSLKWQIEDNNGDHFLSPALSEKRKRDPQLMKRTKMMSVAHADSYVMSFLLYSDVQNKGLKVCLNILYAVFTCLLFG